MLFPTTRHATRGVEEGDKRTIKYSKTSRSQGGAGRYYIIKYYLIISISVKLQLNMSSKSTKQQNKNKYNMSVNIL